MSRPEQAAVEAQPLAPDREVTVESVFWREALQWATRQQIAFHGSMLKGDVLTLLNQRRAELGLTLWQVREGGMRVVRGRLPAGVCLAEQVDA